MPFEFIETYIPGLITIEPKVYVDYRGAFCEIFKNTDLKAKGIDKNLVQANFSKSWKNVLRGLHYQNPPAAQAKLVSCISGEIYDVAVDIRQGSPTYGRWFGINLSGERRNMLYVPEGFAHGFFVLSEEAHVIYFCSSEYSQAHERSIKWDDIKLGITWPGTNPILSDKDLAAPTLENADNQFKY